MIWVGWQCHGGDGSGKRFARSACRPGIVGPRCYQGSALPGVKRGQGRNLRAGVRKTKALVRKSQAVVRKSHAHVRISKAGCRKRQAVVRKTKALVRTTWAVSANLEWAPQTGERRRQSAFDEPHEVQGAADGLRGMPRRFGVGCGSSGRRVSG